jgi:hypothetical protein
VVRKSSDMALLLGARGRLGSRKGGGFLSVVRGAFESLTGRSWRSEQRSQRGRSIPGWLAGVGVLAAFAGGFLAGGRFGGPSSVGNPAAGGSGLHAQGTQQQAGGQNGAGAPTGTQPSVLDSGDLAKLSSHALAVCGYKQIADAKATCTTLRSRGLERARPYEVKQGAETYWLVVVYYDGDSQRQETIQLLQSLTATEAPDVLAARASAENRGQAWPYEWAVK